jgi:hypothetical protein
MSANGPLHMWDKIRRIRVGNPPRPDSRVFEITFIDHRAGVFQARSADTGWSGWGGGTDQLIEGETFEMAETSVWDRFLADDSR